MVDDTSQELREENNSVSLVIIMIGSLLYDWTVCVVLESQ